MEFRNGMVKWNFSRTLQVESKSKLFTEQKILWLSLINEIVWWWVKGRGKYNSLLSGPWDLLWNSWWFWEKGYKNLFPLGLYRRYVCVLHCCVKSKHINAGWIIKIIFLPTTPWIVTCQLQKYNWLTHSWAERFFSSHRVANKIQQDI